MRNWALLGMLSLVVFAGCVDDTDVPVDEPEAPVEPAVRPALPDDPMPEGAGHDHTSVDQHKFLWNYEFTDRDPLLQNQAQIAGLHAIDLQDGHLYGAVYGANTISANGGLAIWDLADPDHPQLSGQFRIPGAVGGDRSLEVTPDGDFAVLGTEAVTCLGQVNPVPVSVYLFDTRDRSQPLVADVISLPGPTRDDPARVAPSLGEHSIAVHNIGGQDYVFIFGKIFRIEPDETTGAMLVDTGVAINVGHDLYVRDTPWGDTWALAANGGGGLQIYNVTDPLAPTEIGNWNLPTRQDGPEYYFHTADVGFFDDQIIVVLSSEDWLDHVSPMWILDGTSLRNVTGDPALLEWIGTWQNPGDHTAIGTSFSLHNPRFHEDGILTISSYHGGLWQLDFRHPDFRTLPAGADPAQGGAVPAEIAYAVYADGEQTLLQDPVHQAIESNLCGLGLTLDAPTYMDVERGPDGHLYAADVYMGLYSFAPTADHPVYGQADGDNA